MKKPKMLVITKDKKFKNSLKAKYLATYYDLEVKRPGELSNKSEIKIIGFDEFTEEIQDGSRSEART